MGPLPLGTTYHHHHLTPGRGSGPRLGPIQTSGTGATSPVLHPTDHFQSSALIPTAPPTQEQLTTDPTLQWVTTDQSHNNPDPTQGQYTTIHTKATMAKTMATMTKAITEGITATQVTGLSGDLTCIRRGEQQDQTGSGYPEQHRYDQRVVSSQHDLRGSDEDRSRDNGESATETPCYAPGALASFKASGVSSSSYELSQFINGAEQTEPAPQATWSTADTGHLIRVSPGLAMQGDPGKVELHRRYSSRLKKQESISKE
ncbi:uncharacterized protein LOC115193021 [Salmo trutta]|uniref:uncharacterized protein LOC115193021 n=1 Tax=Salmo trutta TaxID=8032 RepID=UPI00113012B5|nr:uncharacterized protein LOC115193021 [Salmo trutta]